MKHSHESTGNISEMQENGSGFTQMAEEMPSYEEHMRQYEEGYPDAVEDIDKARAMAEATNNLESRAARTKILAREGENDNEFASERIEYIREIADKKAELAAMDYDYQNKQRAALRQRLEQSENSGRVEDVDKARAMAEASNFQETRAAKAKAEMNKLNFSNDPDYSSRGMFESYYERFRNSADRNAEKAAKKYDEENSAK